jgi:hypothetical protein
MDQLTRHPQAARPATLALVALRRNLFPLAPGYERQVTA